MFFYFYSKIKTNLNFNNNNLKKETFFFLIFFVILIFNVKLKKFRIKIKESSFDLELI